MKLKRIIIILAIIGCIVFASFFGGNIPYALIYISITVPLISFIYTVYVNSRMKFLQKVDNKIVLKDDLIPYSLTLANEDIFAYTNIVLKYHCRKSHIENISGKTEHILLPGQRFNFESTIQCKYRGEYDVGVKSIVITDFLYLFSISYPVPERKTLIVLPKLYQLQKLKILQHDNDPKYTKYNVMKNSDYLDVDVKKYLPGDNKKLIHWKATAKRNELFSRAYTGVIKKNVFVDIDLTEVAGDEIYSINIEDKIIEAGLSIIDYYNRNGTPVSIQYYQRKFQEIKVENEKDFEKFYNGTARLNFSSKNEIEDILSSQVNSYSESFFSIVITHKLTKKLFDVALNAVLNEGTIAIVYISDENSEITRLLIQNFRDIGIEIIKINSTDDLIKALS